MKFLVSKRNYIILLVIVLLVIWILVNLLGKNEIFLKSFNSLDEPITIKAYDKINENKVSNDIDKILKKFLQNKKNKELKEYGRILYAKSKGYVDITNTELVKALRTGESYNFEMIKSSYAVSEICDYFKQNDIKRYIINEGGNVIAGEGYDGKYKVSLNKYDSQKILNIVLLENKSLYTLNKSDEIEDYMVNPKTSKVSDNFDSVSVIANDNLTADMIVRTLFLMSEDEGKEFIKDYDAEALWQKDDFDLLSVSQELETMPRERKVNMTPYEEEQEEKAIISYDELVNQRNEDINYSNEYKKNENDILVKQVDLDKTKKVDLSEIDNKDYKHEEEFLKSLKDLQEVLD